MFHEVVEGGASGGDGDAANADDLLAAFETMMRDAAAAAGREALSEEAGVSAATARAVAGGDVSSVTVTAGAAVLAAADADRDADAVVTAVRDHLLMGMTTAVLDVDTIAARIDADLTGQELQQALEGRTAMTLEQLAEVMAVIERRKR